MTRKKIFILISAVLLALVFTQSASAAICTDTFKDVKNDPFFNIPPDSSKCFNKCISSLADEGEYDSPMLEITTDAGTNIKYISAEIKKAGSGSPNYVGVPICFTTHGRKHGDYSDYAVKLSSPKMEKEEVTNGGICVFDPDRSVPGRKEESPCDRAFDKKTGRLFNFVVKNPARVKKDIAVDIKCDKKIYDELKTCQSQCRPYKDCSTVPDNNGCQTPEVKSVNKDGEKTYDCAISYKIPVTLESNNEMDILVDAQSDLAIPSYQKNQLRILRNKVVLEDEKCKDTDYTEIKKCQQQCDKEKTDCKITDNIIDDKKTKCPEITYNRHKDKYECTSKRTDKFDVEMPPIKTGDHEVTLTAEVMIGGRACKLRFCKQEEKVLISPERVEICTPGQQFKFDVSRPLPIDKIEAAEFVATITNYNEEKDFEIEVKLPPGVTADKTSGKVRVKNCESVDFPVYITPQKDATASYPIEFIAKDGSLELSATRELIVRALQTIVQGGGGVVGGGIIGGGLDTGDLDISKLPPGVVLQPIPPEPGDITIIQQSPIPGISPTTIIPGEVTIPPGQSPTTITGPGGIVVVKQSPGAGGTITLGESELIIIGIDPNKPIKLGDLKLEQSGFDTSRLNLSKTVTLEDLLRAGAVIKPEKLQDLEMAPLIDLRVKKFIDNYLENGLDLEEYEKLMEFLQKVEEGNTTSIDGINKTSAPLPPIKRPIDPTIIIIPLFIIILIILIMFYMGSRKRKKKKEDEDEEF